MAELKKTAQDAAKAVTEEVKAETAKAVEAVKPAVEKAAKATRKRAAKTAEKAEKAAAKAAKTAEKAKTGVKRAAAKAVTGETAPVVYVQYQGAEESVEDLVAAAKAAFKTEHLRTKIEELKLYIKPEERAAYYVVNGKFDGKVEF